MKTIARFAFTAAFLASTTSLNADDEAFSVADAWAKDCQKCHAEDGSGLTKKGRKLRLRDYRKADVQAEMKDEEMIHAIKAGVEKDGEQTMNAFGEDYSDEEIEAFVAFVRSLKTE